jgi:hypothetical protein
MRKQICASRRVMRFTASTGKRSRILNPSKPERYLTVSRLEITVWNPTRNPMRKQICAFRRVMRFAATTGKRSRIPNPSKPERYLTVSRLETLGRFNQTKRDLQRLSPEDHQLSLALISRLFQPD